ncbi:hypothetical protein SBA3_420006 [Candidatus Sulfopaludibacter sp. SbA3]|nr:hypothetical protein SBA3_420006 [Candidatus Sulfopaludibacter sp. SbA3]
MAKQRVLVVDDSQVNLRVTNVLLVSAGYEVGTALSAEKALQKLASFRPHLLILSFGSSALDGLELLSRIKSSAEWGDLPIVALIAPEMPHAEATALAACCAGCLPKPVDVQALRDLIRRLLDAGASEAPAPPQEEWGDPFTAQREEFRRKGKEECRRLLSILPLTPPKRALVPLIDYQDLRKALHGWAGLGGTLGFPQITENARAGEALLDKPFEEIAIPLRRLVEDLLDQFVCAIPAGVRRPAPVPVKTEAIERKQVILIGEDDPIFSSLIKTTLENEFECRIADNGRLAFAMAHNDPPDAMILDVNMPNLDGFQVLEELRRLETTRNLRIMLLTARHETADIRRGVHLGVNDYMVKPFEPAELLDRVRKLLAG